MSTEPRKASERASSEQTTQTGDLLACQSCNQQMAVPIGEVNLPLHMYRGVMCAGSGLVGAPPKFGVQIKEPLTVAEISKIGISEILSADTCLACGGQKAAGQTICTTDYGLLPFVIQKCLPPHVKGYLYADEKNELAGISKQQFLDIFKSALQHVWAARDVRLEESTQ